MIVAGLVVLREILARYGLAEIEVSERDLLDGAALAAAELPGSRGRARTPRRLHLLLNVDSVRQCARSPTTHVSRSVRALAGPPARAADGAPRRQGRDVGQARGLQLGPRLRRQQDAEARVPRRRRARPGLRHARLDRRRPVEPHAPGRGRGGAPGPRLRARPGALGRVGRPRLRRGRQHPPLADHGRGRAALRAGFDIGFRPSWEEALASVEARGGKPYAIPAGASDHPLGGSASPAGRTRWPSRSASSASSSTRSSSAR